MELFNNVSSQMLKQNLEFWTLEVRGETSRHGLLQPLCSLIGRLAVRLQVRNQSGRTQERSTTGMGVQEGPERVPGTRSWTWRS